MTQQAYSFELDEEMLGLIAKEFDIGEVVKRFKETISGKDPEEIERTAEKMFTRYGVDWMRRSLQLGEEYPDRTYEVLREAIDSTGGSYRFPLMAQRFLEIAYLSAHDLVLLPVYENNPRRLVYQIEDCKMFKALEEECGKEVADTLPCRHACLNACRTLFTDLDYPEVLIDMEAYTNKDGYCQFAIKRL